LEAGRKATLLCKEIYIVAKSEAVKTGCNLSEFSKEGYGSKSAVFPVVATMMMLALTCPI
jgi:hypothetical protein